MIIKLAFCGLTATWLVTPACSSDMSAPQNPQPTVTEASHAAVIYGSCVDESAQGYLLRLYSPLRTNPVYSESAAAACLGRSDDGCAAVERCLPITYGEDPGCATVCENGHFTFCAGNGEFLSYALPTNLVCDENGRGFHPKAGRACDEDTFVPRCDGDRPVTCDGDFESTGDPCADFGLVCTVDVAGRHVSCEGAGEPCSSEVEYALGREWMFGTCIDADTLVNCVNGKAHAWRCSDVMPEFTCQDRDANPSFCGLGTECDPSMTDGLGNGVGCDGDAIVVCNGGRLDHFDCPALGFATCVGADIPHCVPGPFPDFRP